MKQAFTNEGNVLVEEIPVPACGDNEILVKNAYSLISAGTEIAALHNSGKGITSVASTAINRPELIFKAIEMVKKDGIDQTLTSIKSLVSGFSPLGYSSSGTVIEIGKNIKDISIGDRVACAGTGYANHAEVIVVPRNLTCKIPNEVSLVDAAFTTVGAIAMQGIRRASVQFGSNVVVVGLGLLGQIACQILKATGAHVIGIDMAESRNLLALEHGADICFKSGKHVVDSVLGYTNKIGADSIIIYAATESNEPVNQAMQMARKKGKVVVVGSVGMNIDRSPFYEKELDFLISCSYGPGRYDPIYEESGIDYPIGYIRWTENRNMQEFLRMISEKKINLERLINKIFTLPEAKVAYRSLNAEPKPIGVLFKYEDSLPRVIKTVQLRPPSIKKNKINVAVIGAGSYSQAYHLPNLKKIPDLNLRAVVTRTGINAKKIAEKYGAEYCTSNYMEVLNDDNVDMVIIATRHNLHMPIIIEAAKAGKQIFTEKPVALTYDDCKRIYEVVTENRVNFTVGFNRRFAPLAKKAKMLAENRKNPLILVYRINSAGMKNDHWINNPIEGGGAIIGEGCHFFDFCNWMIGNHPTNIYANMISSRDNSVINSNNVISTLKYGDGSLASIIYTTIGCEAFPKERIELFFDGGAIAIDDFRELVVTGLNEKGAKLKKIEKGQFDLINEYISLLKGKKSNNDIPNLLNGIDATICSLKVLDSLRLGKPQEWMDVF